VGVISTENIIHQKLVYNTVGLPFIDEGNRKNRREEVDVV